MTSFLLSWIQLPISFAVEEPLHCPCPESVIEEVERGVESTYILTFAATAANGAVKEVLLHAVADIGAKFR